jgi:archaellum component FlaC
MHGEDKKKSPSQLQKGLPDIDAIIEHRLNLYELAHEERDKRMNSILLNEVSTLENRFKEFEGAAEEEARRLERVECELHQQLLSSKQNIEHLETQIDALLIFKENLGMELNILKGGLQDYFNYKDHVQRCNTDLELDVCTTKRNLEDKIERLTVMIADMHNRETAMSKERKQAETLDDVHQILRTLGTAVKTLQRHVAKNNSEMHSVRETFENIRLNLRQHEGAVNGYLESWSVESSGMTQQILSLWKIVRAQAHTQAQEHLSTDSLSLSERGVVAATTGEHDRDSPRGGESSTRESEKQSDTSVVDAESSCKLHRKGSNATQWPHPPPLQTPTYPHPPPHRPHP